MDAIEVKDIAVIMLSADGGCPFCSHSLIEQFAIAFPQFRAVLVTTWEEEYKKRFDGLMEAR